ncbi:MAG: GTP-binding protein [Actinomycetota bacterium]|jgi:sulfate adenylyltransferase large subunit|nr:GTP-binding protein [Actinomycetota bacterium]
MGPLTSTSSVAPGRPGELLRFAAVGSVDDGKSTLIGRLLHDTKQLFDDQLAAVGAASRRRGAGELDLSFVTDGLRAEREQGITIDVAYRYAATPARTFVIADCPGHVQYTRNMATGASTADLALVVIDATSGLREQTRRHVCIASLLGVRTLVVVANKMDRVAWDPAAYERVVRQTEELATSLGAQVAAVVPASALHGDNVAVRSDAAPWYEGPTVLEALETAPAGGWAGGSGSRLAVQWVLRRPGGGRSYAGMVSGGTLRPGDPVTVLPSGHRTTVASLGTADGPLAEAAAGLSVAVELSDDLDVGRGDLLAGRGEPPVVTDRVDATVCWFAPAPLLPGARYLLKHTTRVTPGEVEAVSDRLDVRTLLREPAQGLGENDIGTVTLATADLLAVDPYRRNRVTGSFVLVDPATHATAGAGMVARPLAAGSPGPTAV